MIKLGGLVKQTANNKKSDPLREGFEKRRDQVRQDIKKMLLASNCIDVDSSISSQSYLKDLVNKITEYIMYKA